MKKIVFSLTVFISVVGAAVAQTADEILVKSIEARGGAAKLNGLKSLKMESVTSVMGMDMVSKSVIVNKRGMRNDIEVMGQTITMAVDGDKGWMINPMQGGTDPVALPEEQLKASAVQLDLAGMTNYKEAGTTAELLGKETMDGTEVYKIKTTSKDGMVMTHSIDTKTYYILKTAIKVKVGDQEIEAETKMSNYKVVDGIAFAHTTEITNPQAGVITTTIKKLEVNPTVDESVFAMPKK
jgi:outer membrane lipoprotein-sorting protein